MEICEVSPLYKYWLSEQTDEDETERLSMANLDSKASFLFVKEPYKWEILFQSIAREIINGDRDSIRAMHILLGTINIYEKEKIIENLKLGKLFDEFILEELKGLPPSDSNKKSKPIRFIKILLAIFTNPYGLVIKREKKHIYEKTGSLINNLINKIS